MNDIFLQIGLTVFGGIASVVWWLLRQKDEAQAKQIEVQEGNIETLFRKHDEDAKRLQDLELEIAKNHYLKNELDAKFDRMEAAFREGLGQLGAKFDKLADAIAKANHG